jgi:ribosomal protein S18 acetylase RimI-like enzyme
MQAVIRKATESDIVSVLPLWRELMEFHSTFDFRFQVTSDAVSQGDSYFRAELITPTSLLAVADCDSRIVGYCLASCRQQPKVFEHRAYGFISEFHVLPSFRRQGIGSRLFAYARQWFGERSISRIELVTINANDGSNAFWQRMGCRSYAERRFLNLSEPNKSLQATAAAPTSCD